MAEYINKENLKFMKIPIAPVIQGEQVHCEDGFLKEWLESVPTEDVVERDKVKQAREEIENEIKFWSEPSKYNVKSVVAMKNAKAQSYKHCLEILDKLIAESEG